MVVKIVIVPENIFRLKRIPVPSSFKNATISAGKFQNIALRYQPDAHFEASAEPWANRMIVSNKFFQYNQGERKHILFHEIGHFYARDILRNVSLSVYLRENKIFGTLKDTTNGWGYYDGIFGQSSIDEAVAESFAVYFTKPSDLKKWYPKAFEFIDTYCKT